MISASAFRDLVSGRRRGVVASTARGLLRVAEVPYSLAMRLRNRRYDRGRADVVRVDAPVISVGNLTLGGTGKTPVVAWIARWLREQGIRVAVVSRGYGAEAGSQNDEAMELEERLPDVPHLQNPDRVAAAETAIEELASQVIVMDDGFQHRRLARDLDIVLLDALDPFGMNHVFPRGMLREPLSGLARADVVALTRSDMIGPDERDSIRRRAAQLSPESLWCELAHTPEALIGASGARCDLSEFAGQPVAGFCGIGNPDGFRHTLESCQYQLTELREFSDHHDYQREDIESLRRWADTLQVEAILCTHKDLVKIKLDRLGSKPLWAVTVSLGFSSGQQALEQRLQSLLQENFLPTPATD